MNPQQDQGASMQRADELLRQVQRYLVTETQLKTGSDYRRTKADIHKS